MRYSLITGIWLFLIWLAGSAAAQGERVLLEWDRWLERMGNPDAALVFMIEDAEIVADARGLSVDTALPLASNSKAITALCVDALVREGAVSWDDLLTRWYAGAHSDLTVSHLVTHQSGLGPDGTQLRMLVWRGSDTPRWGQATHDAFARRARGRPGGDFAYNNENYAVLGDLIEQATGQGYEQACRARVLAPMGMMSAVLEPPFGGFGPWGGWSVSVRDYARLVRQGFAERDPKASPHVAVTEDGAVIYGLGMLARLGRFAPNHWHFGALCFGRGGVGAMALDLGGRYTVVAAYEACTNDADRRALEQALVRAIFAD